MSILTRTKPAPNPALAEAEARIREQDAAAAREHQAQLNALHLRRVQEDQAERAERKHTKHQTKHQRKAAVVRFWSELPARMVTVPVALAAGSAWLGQYGYAAAGLGWSPLGAAALATALECMGLSLGALARKARNAGDSAVVERTLMWSIVGTAAAANGAHSGEPVLAVMSVAGVAGWEAFERRRYRDALAASGTLDRPERRPRFGMARWARYPIWTGRAWSIAVRDRLGPGEAQAALDRASSARNQRRLEYRFRPWKRRHMADRVRASIEAQRAADVDRANSILAQAQEVTAAAGMLFGPDKLRAEADRADVDQADPAPIEQPQPRRLFRRSRRSGQARSIEPKSIEQDEPPRASGGGSIEATEADGRSIEPTRSRSIGKQGTRSATARGKSIEQLKHEAQDLISAGKLPASPDAEPIRKALRCGPDRAREVREALRAKNGTEQTAA